MYKIFFLILTMFLNFGLPLRASVFHKEICGNGKIEKGEECDIKKSLVCNDNKVCGCNCKCLSICGNKFKGENEECDDGNNINGDGCSESCKIENKFCFEKCRESFYNTGKESLFCNNGNFKFFNGKKCCCTSLNKNKLKCESYKNRKITFKELLKYKKEIAKNCNLNLKDINYEIKIKLSNNQCSQTDCLNRKITIGICNENPGCSENACSVLAHEIEHLKRCNQNKNFNDNLIDDNCNYISEEIIAQNAGFNKCIEKAGQNCNCEIERIYLKKECRKYTQKNCKSKTTIENICNKI